ncbi:hypothetical protein AGABI1DRAFT_132774 [Agaricus bisporus var. burnettii JB137-S8]|uniref:Uncharacterized protein n=1 Tax=Agaricus bisporus var. burnettii (strain JB137-S8 / ATCC MYA-4627 / FGSC 10392) TaxID=597362 RepID=K5VKH3_AGABU|nr:uncharacterized protein AGABI1DRAFT_132774 [Agaricus bisporus var. burnettii JB137-S8]EKM74864.1 hypothetical protein AGABI1DRAFT_132774 [Agaricus bisporus var. burnettii JB137-S8]
MSDLFLQRIIYLVSTFESDVKTSAAPLVWDGVHTGQTIASLGAVNALGVRRREAETEEDAPRGTQSALEDARDIDSGSSFDIAPPKNNLRPAEVSAVERVKLLKDQVHDIIRICSAIVRGNLDQKVEAEAEGEMLALKCTQIYPSVPDLAPSAL